MINQFIYNSMLFILIIAVTFISIFMLFTIALPPQYVNSYHYMINDKYEKLVKMKSPKIIFIAGSSGAFGLKNDLFQTELDLECANIALHAGFGMKFQTEISKGNISEGDIVIIGYEDAQWGKKTGKPSSELIVTAIDNNIKLYKYIPKDMYIDVIKYLPTYFFKKLDSAFYTPIVFPKEYSRECFDSNLNMILKRPACVLPDPVDEKIYGRIKLNKQVIDNELVDYVNEFNKYVNGRGAVLLITFSPALNEAVLSSKDELLEFQTVLDNKLDAPIISDINDYVFKREYFYDTIYHLNDYGEVKRTKLLLQDLKKYLANNR